MVAVAYPVVLPDMCLTAIVSTGKFAEDGSELASEVDGRVVVAGAAYVVGRWVAVVAVALCDPDRPLWVFASDGVVPDA